METTVMQKLWRVCAITTLAIMMFVSAGSAATKTLTLTWDLNTESDIAGYRIHQGRALGGPYTQTVEVQHPTNTAAVTISEDGLYTWVATAFDASGNESGFSNEATFSFDSTAPAAPAGFRLAP